MRYYRLGLLCLFLMVCLPLFAENASEYRVLVPVENQSAAQRLDKFSIALQVLSDRLHADFSIPLEHPEQYVASYSYLSHPEQSDSLELDVLFDRQSLKPFLSIQEQGQAASFVLHVSNIASYSELESLFRALKQTRSIQSVIIERVHGDMVTIKIVYQGSQAAIIQGVGESPHLLFVSAREVSSSYTVDFKWIP